MIKNYSSRLLALSCFFVLSSSSLMAAPMESLSGAADSAFGNLEMSPVPRKQGRVKTTRRSSLLPSAASDRRGSMLFATDAADLSQDNVFIAASTEEENDISFGQTAPIDIAELRREKETAVQIAHEYVSDMLDVVINVEAAKPQVALSLWDKIIEKTTDLLTTLEYVKSVALPSTGDELSAIASETQSDIIFYKARVLEYQAERAATDTLIDGKDLQAAATAEQEKDQKYVVVQRAFQAAAEAYRTMASTIPVSEEEEHDVISDLYQTMSLWCRARAAESKACDTLCEASKSYSDLFSVSSGDVSKDITAAISSYEAVKAACERLLTEVSSQEGLEAEQEEVKKYLHEAESKVELLRIDLFKTEKKSELEGSVNLSNTLDSTKMTSLEKASQLCANVVGKFKTTFDQLDLLPLFEGGLEKAPERLKGLWEQAAARHVKDGYLLLAHQGHFQNVQKLCDVQIPLQQKITMAIATLKADSEKIIPAKAVETWDAIIKDTTAIKTALEQLVQQVKTSSNQTPSGFNDYWQNLHDWITSDKEAKDRELLRYQAEQQACRAIAAEETAKKEGLFSNAAFLWDQAILEARNTRAAYQTIIDNIKKTSINHEETSSISDSASVAPNDTISDNNRKMSNELQSLEAEVATWGIEGQFYKASKLRTETCVLAEQAAIASHTEAADLWLRVITAANTTITAYDDMINDYDPSSYKRGPQAIQLSPLLNSQFTEAVRIATAQKAKMQQRLTGWKQSQEASQSGCVVQ